jgi:hypothetical protein
VIAVAEIFRTGRIGALADMLKFAALASFLLISWSAHAQQTTGELFAQCEVYALPRLSPAQDMSSAKCFAYFSAVH